MPTLTYAGILETTNCWCGINLAIPSVLLREARDSGRAIFCPIGHEFVFGDTFKDQLKKANDKLARERALRDQTEASNSALRGVVTRKSNELARVKNGVCPCCNRTFVNLGRHMATKHPEFEPKATVA